MLGILAAETLIRGSQAYVFFKASRHLRVFSKANKIAGKLKRKDFSPESIYVKCFLTDLNAVTIIERCFTAYTNATHRK